MYRTKSLLHCIYLNAHFFLEADNFLFRESCDFWMLFVKVTSEGRVVNLEKPVCQAGECMNVYIYTSIIHVLKFF